MTGPHAPPGRMGRLWLLDRLELVERGISLLEEKLRLLSERREELQRRADDVSSDWQRACREADEWGLRTVLLGGQRAIALAAPHDRASITIDWTTTAGVRYPDHAECTLPPFETGSEIYTNSATVMATRAHRAAVAAAARCGAAQSALDTIERELRATQVRARALSRHWMPCLLGELNRIELDLEEQERAEAIRLRLVELTHGRSRS